MVDRIVVATDDDHFGGLPANFAAGDVDGPFLVVGYIDDHFQYARWPCCIEDGLFEDFACIPRHGDKRKFSWDRATVGLGDGVNARSFENGHTVGVFHLAAIVVLVDADEACEVVFSGKRHQIGIAADGATASNIADGAAG